MILLSLQKDNQPLQKLLEIILSSITIERPIRVLVIGIYFRVIDLIHLTIVIGFICSIELKAIRK